MRHIRAKKLGNGEFNWAVFIACVPNVVSKMIIEVFGEWLHIASYTYISMYTYSMCFYVFMTDSPQG